MPARVITALIAVLLLPWPAAAEGARYLIICPAEWEAEVQPLADWKTRKGMLAKVATTTETGYSAVEIRSYIEDAVATWDPAPEYVLIVGDSNTIPMEWFDDGWGGYSDTYYGSVDGDTFIELHPGRFPARTATEAAVMVEKTLAYERYPLPADDPFFSNALLVLSEDWDDDDWLHYYGDANWESGMLTAAGYDQVDLLTRGTTPDGTNTAVGILNGGVSFAGYHGVPTGSNVGWNGFEIVADDLANGPMLPIVPVYTCQTVLGWSEGGEKWVRAGEPGDLRGAVAYVGQSISCSYCAHWRSAMRRGFWGLILEDTAETEIVTFGAAVEAGRMGYYSEFLATDQYVGSILYGDPELNIWTAPPLEVAISHPELVPCTDGEVTLAASFEGVPRQGVRICLSGADGAYAYGTTDETGSVTLAVDTRAEEQLQLTATGRNMRPFEAEIVVAQEESAPTDDDDDDTADDDDVADDDTADDDTADDDTGDLVTDPGDTVSIQGQCECRQAGAGRPVGWLALLGLVAVFVRRRS
jgi:MYXO-CTERM domain-containing protein